MKATKKPGTGAGSGTGGDAVRDGLYSRSVIRGDDSPLVSALLADQGWEVETRISPLDTMYTASLPRGHEASLVEYFQRGIESFHASSEIASALETTKPRILEFASGFGRLTRFLTRRYDPSSIVVSDIDEEAVVFSRDILGVRAELSAMEPEDLRIEGPFDLILVYSLFSHLPADLFGRWLRRLYALLAEGGFLVISVHDERMIPESARSRTGLTFGPDSESRFLEASVYGSTWVSSDYVRRAAVEHCPGGVVTHVPYGLSNYQDLYILGRGAAAPHFDVGPFGFFDVCRRDADRLVLIGWAAHHDPARSVASVRVILDGGEIGSTSVFTSRPAVPKHTGEARHELSGWGITVPFPENRPPGGGPLLIKAVSDTGVERFLWIGHFADAFVSSVLQDANALRKENEELRVRAEKAERALARVRRSLVGRLFRLGS